MTLWFMIKRIFDFYIDSINWIGVAVIYIILNLVIIMDHGFSIKTFITLFLVMFTLTIIGSLNSYVYYLIEKRKRNGKGNIKKT